MPHVVGNLNDSLFRYPGQERHGVYTSNVVTCRHVFYQTFSIASPRVETLNERGFHFLEKRLRSSCLFTAPNSCLIVGTKLATGFQEFGER